MTNSAKKNIQCISQTKSTNILEYLILHGTLSQPVSVNKCITLLYPYLTYCNTVRGAACQTTVKPIVTAQKRAVHPIMRLRRYDHTHDSSYTKIKNVNEINIYFCVSIVYKSLNIYNGYIFYLRISDTCGLAFPNSLTASILRSKHSELCIRYHGAIV